MIARGEGPMRTFYFIRYIRRGTSRLKVLYRFHKRCTYLRCYWYDIYFIGDFSYVYEKLKHIALTRAAIRRRQSPQWERDYTSVAERYHHTVAWRETGKIFIIVIKITLYFRGGSFAVLRGKLSDALIRLKIKFLFLSLSASLGLVTHSSRLAATRNEKKALDEFRVKVCAHLSRVL